MDKGCINTATHYPKWTQMQQMGRNCAIDSHFQLQFPPLIHFCMLNHDLAGCACWLEISFGEILILLCWLGHKYLLLPPGTSVFNCSKQWLQHNNDRTLSHRLLCIWIVCCGTLLYHDLDNCGESFGQVRSVSIELGCRPVNRGLFPSGVTDFCLCAYVN
jgi:hypothetical protein